MSAFHWRSLSPLQNRLASILWHASIHASFPCSARRALMCLRLSFVKILGRVNPALLATLQYSSNASSGPYPSERSEEGLMSSMFSSLSRCCPAAVPLLSRAVSRLLSLVGPFRIWKSLYLLIFQTCSLSRLLSRMVSRFFSAEMKRSTRDFDHPQRSAKNLIEKQKFYPLS